jgi:transketolase
LPVDSVISLGNLKAKWEAFGWDCLVVDGHNMEEIEKGFAWAKSLVGNGKPKILLVKTVMGKGVDFMEGSHHWHGKAPNAEQTEKVLSQLKETLGDF